MWPLTYVKTLRRNQSLRYGYNVYRINNNEKGISVTSTRFSEHARVLQRCYGQILIDGACAIDLSTTINLPGFDAKQNRMFSLFYTNEAQEACKFLDKTSLFINYRPIRKYLP